jgi:predicted flap endonuclease-1-like 5' DNA nuclease
MEVFGLFGQVWWIDLILVGVSGLLAGWTLRTLHGRRALQAQIDAIHQRCWAEQDKWQEEREAQASKDRQDLETLREAHAAAGQAEAAARQELDLHHQAAEFLNAEIERLRAEAVQVEVARAGLVEERDRQTALVEQMRRQMDAARAGHRQAEQALCQQLLALDRQIAAERAAHRREIQALRDQCDELREDTARARGELVALHEAQQVRAAQVDRGDEHLREEVTKLLGLLDEADSAQAALQQRVGGLELQAQAAQRQVEDLRATLVHERAAAGQLRQQLEAAQGALRMTRGAEVVEAEAVVPRSPRPFQRTSDSPPPDDLRRIVGIGPVTQSWLNRAGIWYFWQIAGWRPEELQWVAQHLPRFGHRVLQQDWVAQARRLGGVAAPFERRVYPARLPPGLSERRVTENGRELMAA